MAGEPIHKRPIPRKALQDLAAKGDEPTKSELARRVYGRDDSSTRAMISRLTAALVDAGLIEERIIGRERRVRLTPAGRAAVERHSPDRSDWIDPSGDNAGKLESHPGDRPRFHLRHAALLALANSPVRSGTRDDADEHFRQVLLTIIHEDTQPDEDLERFYKLARSWPSEDPRLLLGECIVRFQKEETRSSTLEDLLVVGDTLEPSAEALLWATAAVVVAHHHLVDPRVPSDQIAARGLLQKTIELMGKLVPDGALGAAASYRLALARSVRDRSWNCQMPASTHVDRSDGWVAKLLQLSDDELRSSAQANTVLDPIERVWARSVGPWLVRTLPTSEAVFRRGHHAGASREIHDWKRQTGDQLAGLLRGFAHSDPKLKETTETFVADAIRMARSGSYAGKNLIPHIHQAALLLGREINEPDLQDKRPTGDYRGMVLNNFWTPEMVATAELPRT